MWVANANVALVKQTKSNVITIRLTIRLGIDGLWLYILLYLSECVRGCSRGLAGCVRQPLPRSDS